jgi:DNA-binding MarR family transcriptional regulator
MGDENKAGRATRARDDDRWLARFPLSALNDPRLSPAAFKILIALGTHARSMEQVDVWPSVTRLAKMIGVDRRSATRALAELERCGYVWATGKKRGRTQVRRLIYRPVDKPPKWDSPSPTSVTPDPVDESPKWDSGSPPIWDSQSPTEESLNRTPPCSPPTGDRSASAPDGADSSHSDRGRPDGRPAPSPGPAARPNTGLGNAERGENGTGNARPGHFQKINGHKLSPCQRAQQQLSSDDARAFLTLALEVGEAEACARFGFDSHGERRT